MSNEQMGNEFVGSLLIAGNSLLTHEWIIVVYFTYLLIAATAGSPSRRPPAGRRVRAAIISGGALAAVGLSTRLPADGLVRAWVPGVFLLAGYWTPGLLYSSPDLRLERWLVRIDARVFSLEPVGWIAAKGPRVLLELLEFSYLSCYALVPGVFAILYVSGDAAIGDRFWTSVLLSEFICYGLLPWLPSRPPRTLEGQSVVDRRHLVARRLNLWVLDRVSVQVNTFPSGHVAGSLVAGFVAWSANPTLGIVTSLVAVAITIETVIGRYHYAADAALGAAVGMGVALVMR